MAEEAYRYRAFISYRHVARDRRWARWLIERLETFRTPRALVQRGVPARIGQLFRDDDEIPASSDLSHQIEEALRASQFLIVVCSRDTPGSKWVRREIEFFRSIGRGDRILALLVDGEPHSSFPPELMHAARERTLPDGTKTVEWTEEEPIAADVRPREDERRSATQRRAFLRIAAGLLGVGYDDLVQREQQRRARKRRLWQALAAVLLIAAGAGGYRYWDYHTLHTRYYRDYGTRRGIPFGIGEISAEVASHRHLNYAIDTLRGRVVAMRRENSYHGLMPLDGNGLNGEAWETGVDEWRFPYPGDRAEQIDVFGQAIYNTSRHDSKLMTENFTWLPDGSAVVTFKSPTGGAAALQASESVMMTTMSDAIKQKSQIALHKLRFTAEGYVASRMFQTVWGAPARDAYDSYGRSYEYNPAGQIAKSSYLDSTGSVLAAKSEVAVIRYSYSPQGDQSLVEWQNAAGQLVMSSHGYAIRRTKYDGNGNWTEVAYLGTNRRPMALKSVGFARLARKLDEHGNEIEQAYFGENGERVKHQVWGLARITYRYDDKGNDVEDAGFGLNGEPVLRTDDGFHRIVRRYDAAGNETEEDFFDSKGNPILTSSDGDAREIYSYDDRGNQTGERYFGLDNKPIRSRKEGVAAVARRYDQRGNEREERYFGTDGNPAISTDLGIARETFGYDERGNETEENYFGVDGKPTLRVDWGVARVAYKYDDQGNESEENYFDAAGKPIPRKDWGIARVIARYNGRGKKIEEDYFDADDRPIVNKSNGAAGLRFGYNDWGELTETKRFDVSGHALPDQAAPR